MQNTTLHLAEVISQCRDLFSKNYKITVQLGVFKTRVLLPTKFI